MGELERAAPDVIERAPGRGHHDAGAALEGPDLHRDRRAAVHGHDRDADALGVFVDRFGDLHRQLARRHEHEPARVPARRGILKERLQHRQRERGRLPRAGRGLRQQIPARNQQRNGLALNGRRLFVTEGREGRRQLVDEPEAAESAWCAGDFRGAQRRGNPLLSIVPDGSRARQRIQSAIVRGAESCYHPRSCARPCST